MAEVKITEKDRQDAEVFLEQFLKEKLPDADLSRGTSLRDYLVTGMSLVTAYFRQEARDVKDRQSVKRIKALPPSTDRDEAADEVTSNLFITRKDGVTSRGVAVVYFSQETDVSVRTRDRFERTASLSFKADILTDTVYSADDLVEIRDASGDVIHYALTIPLVAVTAGIDYDVGPGVFSSTTLRNPYFKYAENTETFTGGRDKETTDALLERAPVALTLRDLVTDRAAQTVLVNEFDTVDTVAVVGFGDPEMQRDKVQTLQETLNIHAGGHVDLYVSSAVLDSRTLNATLGDVFTDPRKTLTIFRDTSTDFLGAGVTAGMVLKITNSLIGEGTKFLVREVYTNYLRVDRTNPLPSTRLSVEYTIGDNYPDYDNTLGGGGPLTTGEYSTSFEIPNKVLLPPTPVYKIKDVSVPDTDPPSDLAVNGRIHFVNRVNTTPSANLEDREYRVESINPTETPSAYQVSLLHIASVDDLTDVKVIYDTINEFTALHNFVENRDNRVAGANLLAKGFHVCYLRFRLQYSLKITAPGDIDVVQAKKDVVAYINAFTSGQQLNVSDIISFLQQQYPTVGSVVPVHLRTTPVLWESAMTLTLGAVVQPTTLSGVFYEVVTAGVTGSNEPTWSTDLAVYTNDNGVLYRKVENYTVGYDLLCPDGRVIPYRSNDRIAISKDNLLNPAVDTDALDTATTATATSLGISARTVRYLADEDFIEVINV